MLLDNLNLNLLRVFESVYRAGSMTIAAKELHMTQSGVSQNIKNLEDILEVQLFDRIKQKPIPTHKAKVLFEKCSAYLNEVELTLAEIKGVDRELKGRICIGVPIEFGNNVVLPKLAKWGSKHKNISFKIIYGHASEMNDLLLSGDIDFAFVDEFSLDKLINVEKVASETLTLCAAKNYMDSVGIPKTMNKKYFDSLDFIDYIEGTPVLGQWFNFHYKLQNFEPRIRANLMDVDGMSRMIVHGLGVGVLPAHVVKRLNEEGHDIYLFNGCGNELLNPISMAMVANKSATPAVLETIKYLKSEFKK